MKYIFQRCTFIVKKRRTLKTVKLQKYVFVYEHSIQNVNFIFGFLLKFAESFYRSTEHDFSTTVTTILKVRF